MSPFVRYAFAAFIALYGVYQLTNDHPIPGVIAVFLAVFWVWVGGRR
jgi:hypothetical protein